SSAAIKARSNRTKIEQQRSTDPNYFEIEIIFLLSIKIAAKKTDRDFTSDLKPRSFVKSKLTTDYF
ncbi:MAG: hypothetical protein ACPGSJ_06925, partial [Pseudoalteromonas spongiae]